MTPAPDDRWTTFKETADELRRSPKTIRNLVYKHELPRKIVKVGRAHRRQVLLGERAREKLRELCWGA